MGKVQHFEIPTGNLDRAKDFYSRIFGWEIVDASIGKMKYFIIHTGPTDKKGMAKEKGFINGGLMIKDEG